ncbi:MAG: manganese efflux pump [Ruminococcaceae bacterium]|nr:manganese efflux pump [Oscillospiraceae bacterium]
MIDFAFIFTNVLLGAGLAMDAFSVSLANGLGDHCMKRRRMLLIAATFALFQAIMPLIGWICIRTVAEQFHAFHNLIPWIALFLLLFIGGKMLIEGIRECRAGSPDCTCCKGTPARLGIGALLVQGIATSIDALSVGFTIAEYGIIEALLAALIIATVTFVICLAGVLLGKKFGAGLSGRATILGGSILIVIGIEIFIKGLLV